MINNDSYFFLESDIKISPIASEANAPGKNLPIKKLDNSITTPIRQNTTPSLNFHLFCIKSVYIYINYSLTLLPFFNSPDK